jgi:hypothetical protein
VGQSAGGGRPPGAPRLHRADGADSGRHGCASRQATVSGLGQPCPSVQGAGPAFVTHPQKDYARGDGHEHRAEGLLAFLTPSRRVLRGVRQTNLPGDVGFLPFLRHFRQWNAWEQAARILQAALEPAIACRARRGALVACCDHCDLLQTAIN